MGALIPSEKRILLIYGGGSIKKNGVYDQTMDALKGRYVVEYGGIEPNPSYETCLEAVKLAENEKIDFLLAVGGGSVLDATKFIAAAISYEGKDLWEILLTRGKYVKAALPFGTVLTLPATGSEMNCNSVISRNSTKEKLAFVNPCVYPQFSILDPEVTYSLQKKQLRNGIVDAFIHVMEQYATHDVYSPLQDRQAEAIISTLVESAEQIMADENNYDVRASFMWCTTHALNGIINCGVIQDWATHGIGHELTALFGIDHAESIAIVLMGIWKHQKENKKGKLAQLAERVWGVKQGTVDMKADKAIENTTNFFHSINMPTTLSDYNISADDIQKVVDRFEKRKTVFGEHKNITYKEVKEILNLCC